MAKPAKTGYVPLTFSLDKDFPEKALSISFAKEGTEGMVERADGSRELRVVIGKDSISRRTFFLIPRKITALAKSAKAKVISIDLKDIFAIDLKEVLGAQQRLEAWTLNMEMAHFEFLQYKSAPKEGHSLLEKVSYVVNDEDAEALAKSVHRGITIANELNHARALSNTPGGEMTPKVLAAKAKELAKGTPIKVKVLGEKEMQKLGMGAILGVSQGSTEEAQFIIMEYTPLKKEAPLVLVGKGITFDTGGLNLKPTSAIYEMHMDMAGGAAVIAAIIAAAKLGVKKNIVALIPAAENMPSGSSYRPGDILKSLSGKTIEVLNTDAEGRLILADALTYAEQYKPRLVVDVATLTGAAMVALGNRASALFTKDSHLEYAFRNMGEETGDYVWPLPLWDEYEKEMKGTFGDLANDGKSRYGGATQGAIFLYQFAKNYPWVHLDIAPRMTPADDEYLAKGAAGAAVRLLVKLLETY